MTGRARRLLVMMAVAAAAAAGALAADRPTLDELRRAGTVGERYDGFAVVRDDGAPAAAREVVAEVNEKRRAIYEKRAREQNVPVDQVGRVYAKQIFAEAPSGTWFLEEGGGWVQKP